MIPPPEVGSGIVLAFGDNRAADGAGAGELVEQCVAIAHADCALQRGQVLGKALEHFEHRVLVGKEHIAPRRRVSQGGARLRRIVHIERGWQRGVKRGVGGMADLILRRGDSGVRYRVTCGD